MKNAENLYLAVALILFIALPASPLSARENEIKEYETALAKATLSLEKNDSAEAIKLFKQAQTIKPGSKEAALGLGIAYSRSGNLQESKASLLKALSIDPADARTRYELGVVMYKLGATEEASDFFTAAAEKTGDDDLKTASRKYLEMIAGGKKDGKRFSLGLSVGTQYDTNVILEPDNPAGAVQPKKSDIRGVLTMDAAYRFYQSNATTAEGGYSFYQSVHKRIHDFNVQQHALKLAAVRTLSGTSQTGLKYSFTYSLVGNRRFSEVHEAVPFISFQFAPKSITEFHFVFDNNRYYNTPVFPGNADQTSSDRTAGIIHSLRIGSSTVMSIGYDFNVNDANKRYWSYTGHKGSLGFQSTIGSYTATFALSYYDQQYRHIEPGYKRHDSVQEYSAGISRGIGKDLVLNLTDLYAIRDSNIAADEYTRNIIGLFLVTRL